MAPNPTRAGPLRTAGLVCLLGAAFYSFPMILHFTSKAPIIDSNQPLKPEAVRRGAFNNSGSRDIGPEYVFLHIIHKQHCSVRQKNAN